MNPRIALAPGGGGVLARWHPWPIFLLLAALSVVVWQLVGADLTFVMDDWKVFGERSLSIDSLLTPYNEHLSAVPIALLVGLRDTIGLGWHGVYLLLVSVAHVAAAAGIVLLAVRRQERAVALGLGVLALFLGVGWADLLWAFQLGAVVSVAAGIWALICLDTPRPRPLMTAVLTGISIASSSFGLPFAAAALAFAALRRDRKAIACLGLVGVAYCAWYLRYHSGAPPLCTPPSPSELLAAAGPFAASTLAYAVGAPLGLGQTAQLLMPVAAILCALWLLGMAGARPRWNGLQLTIAALAGIAVMAVLIAYGRGCMGIQAPGSSRYAYVTGMMALVAFAGTRLGGPVGRLARSAPRAAIVTAVAVVMGLQAIAIAQGHEALRSSSDTVRAGLTMLLTGPGSLCQPPSVVVDDVTADLSLLPNANRARELVPSPSVVAAPSWVPSPAIPPDRLQEVRHLMCESPSSGD